MPLRVEDLPSAPPETATAIDPVALVTIFPSASAINTFGCVVKADLLTAPVAAVSSRSLVAAPALSVRPVWLMLSEGEVTANWIVNVPAVPLIAKPLNVAIPSTAALVAPA